MLHLLTRFYFSLQRNQEPRDFLLQGTSNFCCLVQYFSNQITQRSKNNNYFTHFTNWQISTNRNDKIPRFFR